MNFDSIPSLTPLPREFFSSRDALALAPALLGCLLVRPRDGIVARITETEAYMGQGDPACHANQGRCTPRTRVMFSPGGVYYVYFTYGMYHCLNIVSGAEGSGEAVLIRLWRYCRDATWPPCAVFPCRTRSCRSPGKKPWPTAGKALHCPGGGQVVVRGPVRRSFAVRGARGKCPGRSDPHRASHRGGLCGGGSPFPVAFFPWIEVNKNARGLYLSEQAPSL